ncbi:SUMF1/EgtB/PvdO family nonheme iron enzyme [Anaerolineales bacterium HSG24]|nr:SUMF1/EgtB/PvdO family nonheme iron enzyme [Anaerolineales bacterium HSG24]
MELLTTSLAGIAAGVATSFLASRFEEDWQSMTGDDSAQVVTTYQQGATQREAELLTIQRELIRYRKMEVEAGLVSTAEQGRQALQLSEQSLNLKRQEITLYQSRLQQDSRLAANQQQQLGQALQLRQQELSLLEQDLTERRGVSRQLLELMRQREESAIQRRLDGIQADWDRENWAGILSRAELQQILTRGQQRHRLLMFISPPDISDDCPRSFRNNLERDVRSKLKQFISQHYQTELGPVEFFGKSFKSSIFDTQVKQMATLLEPTPMAIIYSDITDEQLYLHLNLWGLGQPFHLTEAWNWEEEHDRLIESGMAEKKSLRQIRQAIVNLHQVGAALLADLYYLALNPTYSPRLFDMQIQGTDALAQVIRQLQTNLRQQTSLAEAQRSREAERKRREAEERERKRQAEKERQRKAKGERKRQAELERQRKAKERERKADEERKRQAELERQRKIVEQSKIQFDWITISAGSFWMGADDLDGAKPMHEVYLPEYQIARTPVTNAQWAQFLQDSDYDWEGIGRSDQFGWHGQKTAPRGREQHPVVWVTWHDALAFCDWANQAIPSAQRRGTIQLPSEAEWEKAARGMDKRIYPWGNQEPTVSLLNFNENVRDTTPVGQYPQGASYYGLLDMAGNVWEWTRSEYRDYPYKSGDGREDVTRTDVRRVLRGGAFRSNTVALRAAYRYYNLSLNLSWGLGFRLISSPF